MTTHRYKAVWLSDIHLGYKDCRAEFLLDFLENIECEHLFLVGDVVDFWALKRQIYWPISHQKVLQHLLDRAKSGCKVIYIPGNHDEPLRDYCGTNYQGLEVHRDYVYNSIAHGKLLLLHGDEFDSAVCCGKLQSWIGDHGYTFLLTLNRWYNRARARLGFPYWSLANYIKNKVKNATAAIRRFEDAALFEAKRRGVDGVVCGHIHSANLRKEGGLLYINDGDWVESCTAAVEYPNGEISLLHWSDAREQLHHLVPVYSNTVDKAA